MLLVGALVVFKVSGLVQLSQRTSDVVVVTVCGKNRHFMTNVMTMVIIFPVFHQDLRLPETNWVKKEPEKWKNCYFCMKTKMADPSAPSASSHRLDFQQ